MRGTFVAGMSIFGRLGLLMCTELSARFGVRPRRRAARGASVAAQDTTLADYYANLELPYGADVVAVREARRQLLKRYHPDLHSADPDTRRTATLLTQGLNRAHDELVSRLDRNQR